MEQLAAYTEKEILAVHGVGPKAIRILAPVMAELGVRFRVAAAGSPGDQD